MTKQEIEYDIAIRTVGSGGGKYIALLQSIKNLEDKPKHIYVILPEGAKPPIETIGNEVFVYANRGMITQRLAALDVCQSKYILFCDDDIQFASDFVAKLYRAVTVDGFSFATGEVLEFLPPKRGIKHWLPIIQAAAVPTLFHKDRYVTVLRSSGWTYNRFTPTENLSLPTQSAAGCMFFCSREKFVELHFEEELWAQHGHLAPADDQIMFYKAHLKGLRVCVVTDAHYDHLSAKSATSTDESKLNKAFWSAFNRAVFWKKFIYDCEKGFIGKLIAVLAFTYYRIMISCHSLAKGLFNKKDLQFAKKMISGFRAGLKFNTY